MIAETTTKDSEYDINLVGRAAAGFERTDSNSERNSIVHKILSKALQATEKHFIIGRVCRCYKLHSLILRNCHSHSNHQQPAP